MQGILYVTCFIFAVYVNHNAVAAQSSAVSGDFLVSTVSDSYGRDPVTRYQLTVLSPTGSLRFSLNLTTTPSLTARQTSVSPDGQYAFTSASSLERIPSEGRMFITRIKGPSPAVVQTVSLPADENCVYDRQDTAAIAVGNISVAGNYDIYVSRQCIQNERVRSVDVLNLRYNPSTRNVTRVPGKAYNQGNLDAKPDLYFFVTLKVLQNTPYGLLRRYLDPGKRETYDLIRLGGNSTTFTSTFTMSRSCDRRTLTIASSRQFYGLCALEKPDFDRARETVTSVSGASVTAALPPPDEQYLGDNPFSSDRFAWESSPAIGLRSRDIFTFLRDIPNANNLTLYKMDSSRFENPPTAVFRFPPYLVLARSTSQTPINGTVYVKELHVVP